MRDGSRRLVLVLAASLVGLWLVAPMLIVIPMSFTGTRSFQFPPPTWSTEWYSNFFTEPAWREALVNSVEIAFAVMIVATTLGTAAALALDRGRIPGKAAIAVLLASPMIVPVVIVAIGVYAVFLNWQLVGTVHGFILAHCALALPFPFVTVTASLQSMDRTLEKAAASLGARPFATFWTVTLPLIRPGVLTGALFAFAISLDEIVVSLFLSTPSLRTLPVQMYTSITEDIDPTIAAASTLLLLTTTVALLVLGWVSGRRRARV